MINGDHVVLILATTERESTHRARRGGRERDEVEGKTSPWGLRNRDLGSDRTGAEKKRFFGLDLENKGKWDTSSSGKN